MISYSDDMYKHVITHDDYSEAKEDIAAIFEEFFQRRGSLITYSIACAEYEGYFGYGSFTSERAYYLFIMDNFLKRTNTMHEMNKVQTLKIIRSILDNPEKLELEEEDKADLTSMALMLLPIVENIETHQDDNRA